MGYIRHVTEKGSKGVFNAEFCLGSKIRCGINRCAYNCFLSTNY